jgi:hypothetical protein
VSNPYPRLLKGFALLSESDQVEILDLVESMAAKAKPKPVAANLAPEPRTYTCKEQGCYKRGHVFSELGWKGEPGKSNGHIHISPAHRI